MEQIKIYQSKINNIINNYLDTISNQSLREKLEYSLSGGKRLRSMIVYELCLCFKINTQSTHILILIVEFLHSASLILDDLPSMDNDSYRRNKLTLHKKYGIREAYIVANYLFSDAMKMVWKLQSNDIISIINYINTQNKKATIGQYYDLFRHNFELQTDNDLIYYSNLKTLPFFSISFTLPYLLNGNVNGNGNYQCEFYENLAKYFSYAFQIVDDFEDEIKDKKKKLNNHIFFLGHQKAYQLYQSCLTNFREILDQLKINSVFFEELIKLLEDKMSEYTIDGNI